MPLLPLARSRAWLVVSDVVMIHYQRFWLSSHFRDTAVLGTPYDGEEFFDYCVTWIKYAPVVVWLVFGGHVKCCEHRFSVVSRAATVVAEATPTAGYGKCIP